MNNANPIRRPIVNTAFIVVMCAATAGAAQDRKGVDHSAWHRLLQATVSEKGWVNYRAVRKKWADTLQTYITSLGAVNADKLPSDAARKAFWINAYNAVTIQTLLDEGLPSKVPHAAIFGKNIFEQKNYKVGGKVRSLDQIEHKVLRKRFNDPRIHAALVCGASSCPRLRPAAYTGKNLDSQLTEEARRWVRTGRDKAGQRKNHLDKENGVYHVSKIFKWFTKDFYGGGKEGVLTFLKKYADDDVRAYLKDHEVKINYLNYKWALNNQGQ